MSRRALSFLSEAVGAHGRPLDAGRVAVPLSQAELARRRGCSAGTVAYYLREAGEVVVARSRSGLVVDLIALDTATHRLAGSPGRFVKPHGPGSRHLRVATSSTSTTEMSSPPPPALSGAQVVEVVSTLAQCLTQIGSELGALGNQLLAALEAPANPANYAGIPREFAASAAAPANVAGGFSLESVPRKEESLPSSVGPRTREPRGSAPDVGSPTGITPLPFSLVDELVGPLRAYARRCGRPDILDDNGRQLLATLTEPELRHGVQRAQRECEADDSIRKPLGLLVHKVRNAREDFFVAPPAPTAPRALVIAEPEARVDEEAAAAVTALEGDVESTDELGQVDEDVQTWLEANVVKESTRQVMLRVDRRGLRQAAWRRLHPRGDGHPAELAG